MRKTKLRTLCILAGVLLAAVIAAVILSRYEEKQEEIKNSNEIILAVVPENVTALSWEYDDTSLSFHREDGWEWDDDAAFPVDDDAVNGLLELFSSFEAAFRIENVTDYGQYGLDDPTAVIRITEGETEYEITLGAYSTMDSERYLTVGDGNVYLAVEDPMDSYELTISDLILHDSVPELTDASSIAISGSENYTIRRMEESTLSSCADDVFFAGDKPLDTASVNSLLKSLHNTALSDYVTYNATEEELAAYGLDTPELTFTVVYPVEDAESGETSNETIVIHLGRNQEELEEALTAAEDSEGGEAAEPDLSGVTAYLRVGDSQIVYRITSSQYQKLTAVSYNDLRHSEIVTASFDDVTGMEIVLEGETYTLTADTNEDEETIWYYGEENEINISDIEDAVGTLSAEAFTEEAGTGKEELRFTLFLANETWPEIEVVLYRYDGSSCIAEVNGEPVAFIPRSQAVDLIEAINEIVLN